MTFAREPLSEFSPNERLVRPEKHTFIVSASSHFYIHFDTTGSAAPDLEDSDNNSIPDYIDEVGIIADSAYTVLVDILGFSKEPFDGEGGYDIYIMNYAAGYYGINIPELNGTSFIQIDNDYVNFSSNFGLTPIEIMRIVVGHEYFHAIQRGYEENVGSNAYFYEMSSTWFEDVLVPDGNDYLDGWADPLLNNPTAKFGSTGYGYELALYGHYLSNHIDLEGNGNIFSSSIIRELWESFGQNSYDAFATIEFVLHHNYNISFIETWIDFMSRNLFNGIDEDFYYYEDQDLINPINTNSILLNNADSFTLELDDESIAIQSFSNTTLDILLSIGHSSNDYLGRVVILSPNNTNLFWATDTSNIELADESEIHFLYGSSNMDSVSINLLSTPDNNNYDATEASILVYPNEVKLFANGFIGGVEMTLSHSESFQIELTDGALYSDFITEDTETRLLIIIPETDHLFSYSGDFDIEEVIVANSQDEVPTEIYYYNYNIGDVNVDGELNILDVVALVDIIMSNGDYIELGDINNDLYLNIMDVVQLINLILL